jgi:hypothetical protein
MGVFQLPHRYIPAPWRGWRGRSSAWLRGGEEIHGIQKEVK